MRNDVAVGALGHSDHRFNEWKVEVRPMLVTDSDGHRRHNDDGSLDVRIAARIAAFARLLRKRAIMCLPEVERIRLIALATRLFALVWVRARGRRNTVVRDMGRAHELVLPARARAPRDWPAGEHGEGDHRPK